MLNAAGRLDAAIEAEVRNGVIDAAQRFSAYVDVRQIDVVIQLCEFEVHARTFGPESFAIYLNPNDSILSEWTQGHFSHLAAHEFHHTLRWRSLSIRSFEDWTPGEVLVLEGLATNCELFLRYPAHDALKVADKLVEPLLDKLKPDVDARYSEVNWFDREAGLPCPGIRAATAMGHLLVRRFLKQTNATPISALAVPWREVWDTVMLQ
ncbi:MAG: DUF2268 domain-containing putative Zn-dependent protease [Pseudomonadota bacterium]